MDDVVKGKWNQFKGDINKRWGKLTDDDLTKLDGARDKLIGKTQELYGTTRDEVSRQLRDIARD